MNKKVYYILFAISLLFVGCSQNDDDDSGLLPNNGLSDVPVLLSGEYPFTTSSDTRSSIDSISQIGESLGIFCVAREKTGITGSNEARDVDWLEIVDRDAARYGLTTNGIYWRNVKCKTTVMTGITDTVRIEPCDGEDYIWYYPITSWFGYDFFGYYPYQNGYNGTSDTLSVDFTIDGSVDLLWGRSNIISGNKSAYSARYFRTVTTDAAHMKFVHKLSQFRFFAVGAKNKDDIGSYDEVKALSVKEIRVMDANSQLRLTLANRTNPERNGTLSINPDYAQTADFVLKDMANADLVPVPITTHLNGENVEIPDTIRVGESIMVFPGDTAYYMSIGLCDTADIAKEYWSEKRITLSLTGNKAFEAGKIYNIYISVSGVSKIGFEAELEDWVETTDDDLLKFKLD